MYVMLPLLLAIEVALLTPLSQESCCYIMQIKSTAFYTNSELQLSAIFMQGRGGKIWITELLIIPIEIINLICCNSVLKVR